MASLSYSAALTTVANRKCGPENMTILISINVLLTPQDIMHEFIEQAMI